MHLILPIAGRSSRYEGLRPKWMLNHPNGNLMLAEAIMGLDMSEIDLIVVICLREHYDAYGVEGMLEKQFRKLGLYEKLRTVVIESSNSQPHTVYQGLQTLNISGPIFIKDSDNFFRYSPKAGNSICYVRIGDSNCINPGNKSYIRMNEAGSVVNIVEKHIISDTFCVGGYSFADASDFNTTFKKLENMESLYVSHIIYQMILDRCCFLGTQVEDYCDWGTLKEWSAYRARFCTLFIDLDGTLVENSAEYFSPFWGETDAIKENVDIVNRLYESGCGEIIITTTRSAESEEVTREQLKRIGLKYHRILFGLLHGRRIIINDYSRSNPYRSCDAINLSRNSKQLAEMLQHLVVMDGS